MFEMAVEILELVESEIVKGVSLVEIKARIVASAGCPEPGPTTRLFEVTVVKANARFAWKYNDNGRMIPQIYPADNSAVKERVQFGYMARVKVFPKVVKADGGVQYYEIADQVSKGGVLVTEKLYLKAEDGRLV